MSYKLYHSLDHIIFVTSSFARFDHSINRAKIDLWVFLQLKVRVSKGLRSSQTRTYASELAWNVGSCSKYEGNYLKVTHIFRGGGAAARADHVKICERLLTRLFRAIETFQFVCIVSVVVVCTCVLVQLVYKLYLFEKFMQNFFFYDFIGNNLQKRVIVWCNALSLIDTSQKL